MKNRCLSIIILMAWLVPAYILPATIPPAQAQTNEWLWVSPDLDGDGLPNEVETGGWCNATGCFQTNPDHADTDRDGLTDGQEKLFESDPTSDASPGIYAIYEDSFKTREYYPWQPYGHKLLARGDTFVPPRPDSVDLQKGTGVNLDAIVVRRGTTFSVGGKSTAILQVQKSLPALTNLTVIKDVFTNRWQVTVPSTGTAGKYTLSLGGATIDLFVIFDLPTPAGELTQTGIEKFAYDDNPQVELDNLSPLLGDGQYPPGTGAPYSIPSDEFVAEGKLYTFDNPLESYGMTA